MNARRRYFPCLLAISLLLLVYAVVVVGQSQPQIPAQTRPQTKAETQPQTKAATQEETKAKTQSKAIGNTSPQTKAGTQTNPPQPSQLNQSAISDTAKKIGKRSGRAGSLSARCQAVTENGTRCTRRALAGSKFCQLHGGK